MREFNTLRRFAELVNAGHESLYVYAKRHNEWVPPKWVDQAYAASFSGALSDERACSLIESVKDRPGVIVARCTCFSGDDGMSISLIFYLKDNSDREFINKLLAPNYLANVVGRV